MKNLKKPARLPRKAPSNQTGGTAWGKKLAAEISRMAQAADMKKADPAEFPVHHRLLHGGKGCMAFTVIAMAIPWWTG